jgi:hypothetical protein
MPGEARADLLEELQLLGGSDVERNSRALAHSRGCFTMPPE